MTAASPLTVRVGQGHVRRLLVWAVLLAGLFVLITGLTYARVISREALGGWGGVVHRAVSLGAEDNLGAWYSSLLLLAVSLAWLLCFLLDAQPTWRFGWLVLAALFMALSLDEAGSFHERLGALPGRSQLQVVAVPLAIVGLFMIAFGWVRLRRSWSGVALLVLAFAMYASVPVQERLAEVLRAAGRYGSSWHSNTVDVVLEEGSELVGTLSFLAAALVYVHRLALQRGYAAAGLWLEAPVSLDARLWRRILAGAIALWAAGFAVIELTIQILPHSGFKPGQLGSPSAWFASMFGILIGAAALGLAGATAIRSAPERLRRVWKGAGLLSLLLSVHFGAGQLFTETVFEGSPRRIVAMRVLLAAVVMVAGLAGGWATRAWSRGVAIIAAGVLMALALLNPEPLAGILAFAGFAVLGVGLLRSAEGSLLSSAPAHALRPA
jgi:hypothetical protein